MLGGHRSAEIQDIWCPPGRPTLHNPSHQPCGMDTISGYANSSASWKTQKMIFRKNILNLVKRKKTHSVLGVGSPFFKFHLLEHWFLQIHHPSLFHLYLDKPPVTTPSPSPRKNPTKSCAWKPRLPMFLHFSANSERSSVVISSGSSSVCEGCSLYTVVMGHCIYMGQYVARICTYTTYMQILYIWSNVYYINYILQIRSQSHQWRKGTGFVNYIYI